ncbi:unnamed protein product [Auanema sp. JU1783]|nr:unnamed protein product [Auanema sp. JU1783]
MNGSIIQITKRFLAVSLAKPTQPKNSIPSSFRINAFAVFTKEQHAENPDYNKLGISEAAKRISSKWKSLSEEEKRNFTERCRVLAEKKKAEFEQLPEDKKNEILKTLQQEKELRVKRKLKKEKLEMWERTNRPTQPTNSYSLFLKDEFAKKKAAGEKVHPVKDLVVDIKNKWMTLSAEEKDKYVTKANELKTAYQKDIELWKKNNVDTKST